MIAKGDASPIVVGRNVTAAAPIDRAAFVAYTPSAWGGRWKYNGQLPTEIDAHGWCYPSTGGKYCEFCYLKAGVGVPRKCAENTSRHVGANGR